MHRETPIYRQQFFGPYGQGADLPIQSAIYFQSCISVTFESTFYFYLLKQIFFGTTFYFLESRQFSHYFYFLACTSTFLKAAKSSIFNNTGGWVKKQTVLYSILRAWAQCLLAFSPVSWYTTKYTISMRHIASAYQTYGLDLGVTWVCIHDLTWHQNDLKVD